MAKWIRTSKLSTGSLSFEEPGGGGARGEAGVSTPRGLGFIYIYTYIYREICIYIDIYIHMYAYPRADIYVSIYTYRKPRGSRVRLFVLQTQLSQSIGFGDYQEASPAGD